MKQITFASATWGAKGKRTRCERFLAEMGVVVPSARLVALTERCYLTTLHGRYLAT